MVIAKLNLHETVLVYNLPWHGRDTCFQIWRALIYLFSVIKELHLKLMNIRCLSNLILIRLKFIHSCQYSDYSNTVSQAVMNFVVMPPLSLRLGTIVMLIILYEKFNFDSKSLIKKYAWSTIFNSTATNSILLLLYI